MPTFLHPLDRDDFGLGYALVHPCLTSRDYTVVRITKRGKRFTEVETMHADPAKRMSWRETSRGLWDFPSRGAAEQALTDLRQSAHEYLAQKRRVAA